MKIYHGFEEATDIMKSVVTTGTFDGLHLGHQKIIQRLIASAKKMDAESTVITFSPHPRLVLFPESNTLKFLTTDEERIELFEEIGLQNLVIVHFTKKFSRTTSEDFIKKFLVDKLHAVKVIAGYDHHFGRNREGRMDVLNGASEKYGFELENIPVYEMDSISVSSTKIRTALEKGDIASANKYLSRFYSLFGKVIEGKKLGRGIGFPTANISVSDKNKLIPAKGVYAVYAEHNGTRYKGMMNIGYRPTVEKTDVLHLEVNIFDFEKEIYGEKIKIYFFKRLRDEKKFPSVEAMRKQIVLDKKNSLQCL